MSYLCYLCLLAYNGVQHILCCVFVLFFFVLSMSPVSLDCPLVLAPSVFSNVYIIVCFVLSLYFWFCFVLLNAVCFCSP